MVLSFTIYLYDHTEDVYDLSVLVGLWISSFDLQRADFTGGWRAVYLQVNQINVQPDV